MRIYYTPQPLEVEKKPVEKKPVEKKCEEKPKKYYDKNIICASKTDKLCPFQYGKVYKVVDGYLMNDNGMKNQLPFETLREICLKTNINWKEVAGMKNGSPYFTGIIYCVSSADSKVFTPGFMYPVWMGKIVMREFTAELPFEDGESFCKALSKETPAKFIPVNSIQGVIQG